jgi:RNA polymerase sigma-B factor
MPASGYPDRDERRVGDFDDLDELAAEYARRWRIADTVHRRLLRDDLICRCVPFADRMARRYGGRPEPIEDLQQVARLGLVNSVDRYDPGRGSFTAFAVITICGEMKRHFRDRTWGVHVNRRLQNLTLDLGAAVAELSHTLSRAPSAVELADHLHVTEDQVRQAQMCAAAQTAVPLSTPIDDHGSRQLADLIGARDESIEILPDRLTVAGLLRRLPPRTQRIIALRFYGGRTQAQIAEELGISQMHVSRLIRRALAWLRTAMLTDVPPRWTGADRWTVPGDLQVQVRRTGTALGVTVVGEIDRDSADRLWRRLHTAIALAAPGHLVIDLSGVPLIDVAAAVALRDACTSAALARVGVQVVGVRPLVASVLAVVGRPGPGAAPPDSAGGALSGWPLPSDRAE